MKITAIATILYGRQKVICRSNLKQMITFLSKKQLVMTSRMENHMSDEDIICTCFDLTVKDIKDAYANGATTLDAIMETTQAGTLCGACISDLEELIDSLK